MLCLCGKQNAQRSFLNVLLMLNIFLVLWFYFCFVFSPVDSLNLGAISLSVTQTNHQLFMNSLWAEESIAFPFSVVFPIYPKMHFMVSPIDQHRLNIVNKHSYGVWFHFKPDFFLSSESMISILFHIYSRYYTWDLPHCQCFGSFCRKEKKNMFNEFSSKEVKMKHQSMVYILYYLVIFKCLHHFKC